MIRLNITLPEDIAKQLETKKNKSRFITEALREKIERENRKKVESLLEEGYQATSCEDKELTEDWDEVSIKEWE